jgi:hypothetical protein
MLIVTEKLKDPAAQSLGRKRWQGVSQEERSRLMRAAVAKRTKKLSPGRRQEIAGQASRAYWDRLTPEERSIVMKARAAKRKRRNDGQ